MKRLNELLSILMPTLVTLALVLTGCGTPKDSGTVTTQDSTPVTTEQSAAAETLKPVNLKIVMAGDKPSDQQTVLDQIATSTKDELNIKLEVDYIPWADYQEKNKMMAAGGDEFDIFLNFGFDISPAFTRKQAIRINELFDKYGQDIKANLPEIEIKSGFVGQDQVAIPAVYTKDDIAMTALIRKDLRVKYNIPEIKDLAGMAAYLDAIKANEKTMIPFGSDSFNASTFFLRAAMTDKRPSNFVSVTSWYKDGKDTTIKVQNAYNPNGMFKKLLDICSDGYNRGWFEKDVLSQKDAKGLFIAGKAGAFNTDLFNFGPIEQALKANFSTAELEWIILNKEQPITRSGSNNFSQISSTSKNPERAMMFLNWLQKSQANYDLYMFGIEGKHYTLDGNLMKLPQGIDATNNTYAPTPWFAYNTKWHRLTASESPLTVAATAYFKDATRYVDDPRLLGFTFVPEK